MCVCAHAQASESNWQPAALPDLSISLCLYVIWPHTLKIPQPHGLQPKTFQPSNCILLSRCAAFDALLHALQFTFIFRKYFSFVAYHICNEEWPTWWKKRSKKKERTRQQFIIHLMSEMIYLFACWFHMHTHTHYTTFVMWIECAIFFFIS